MKAIQLPADLERVERLLLSEPLAEPSAALRRRVLDDVRAELRQCVLDSLRSELRRQRARSKWCFAAAVAAILLVSLGVLQATSVALQQRESTPTLADIAWQIQQISPQVSEKDSLHQALLRQIGDEASCGTGVNKLLSELQYHKP